MILERSDHPLPAVGDSMKIDALKRREFITLLKRFLRRQRAAYLRAIKAKARAEELKPLNRASGRFATVFAAGSLAIRYKIFPWDRDELLQAILSCQLDGLRAAKTERLATDTSVSALRRKLITYLQDHRPRIHGP